MLIMSFGETDDQAAMMMEPVGGMDRVVAGFMRKVGHLVQLESQVQRIKVLPRGVEVTYRRNGEYLTARADYVLNCIPMHLLAGIEHNFPAEYAAGFTAIPRGKLFKIGLQMKERFWENEGIFGGISWTMQDIQQIWYPAHGIHRKKGVVLAAYTFSTRCRREIRALAAGGAHQARHPAGLEDPSWLRQLCRKRRDRRLAPDESHAGLRGAVGRGAVQAMVQDACRRRSGNHYLIGDQVSYHPGWQEGAIASAHHAMADIDARERAGGTQVVHS